MKRVKQSCFPILMVLLLFVAVTGCKDTVTVPDVTGQTQADAAAALIGAHLSVGTVTEQCDDVVAAGSVISQDPPASASVDKNSAVNFVVSSGPCPRTVPEVLSLTSAAAQTAITDAHLTVGTVTEQCDDSVAVGTVISQDPASGTSVPPSTPVSLVVSSGPCPVTVPDVSGQTQDAATAAITGAHLAVGTISETVSETVPEGRVISQDPEAGASVPPGTAVNLVVSEGPAKGHVSLTGWVQDSDGNRIQGVDVTLGSELSTTTAADGSYVFYDLAAATGIPLKFAKTGYTEEGSLVDIAQGQLTTANAVLLPLSSPVAADSSAAISVLDSAGNSLDIPAGVLVNPKKKAKATGAVEVQITMLDITDPEQVSAFPGDFVAQPAKKDAGLVQLESFGLADFRVSQDGEKLDLAEGATAQIEIALPEGIKKDGKAIQPGDQIPLWSFDSDAGIWYEEGMGTVVSSAKSGKLTYQATITHFSWWNCDKPVTDKNCLTGRVVNGEGQPLPNATIDASGVDYTGDTFTTTDADGHFCVNVKRGSTVQLKITLPGAPAPFNAGEYTLDGTDYSDCSMAQCLDVGNIAFDLNACVSGYVLYEDGSPLPNAHVFTNYGESTETNESGYYCLATYANAWVQIGVEARASQGIFVEGNGTCAEGNCRTLNFALSKPVTETPVGLIVGAVPSNSYYWCPSGIETQAAFPRVGDVTAGIDFKAITNALWAVNKASAMYMAPWANRDTVDFTRAWDPGTPGQVLSNSNALLEVARLDTLPALFEPAIPCSAGDTPVQAGDLVAYTWPGGFDIGAFETSGAIPQAIEVISPLPAKGTPTVDFHSELPIEWTPSDTPADFVQIIFWPAWQYRKQIKENYEYNGRLLYCLAPDTGSYTIPKEALESIPVSGGYVIDVVRVSAERVSVPLVAGGSGYVWQLLHGPQTSVYVTRNVQWPEVSFTATPSVGLAPLTVQFTDTSLPGEMAIAGWQWSFGDGGSSTEQNPAHVYTTSGSYSVWLELTDADGYYIGYYYRPVEVLPADTEVAARARSDFMGSQYVPCQVQFTDLSYAAPGFTIVSWAWDFGDGTTSTDPSPLHTYTTTGYFSPSLTVTADSGASDTWYLGYIYVYSSAPEVYFSPSVDSGTAPLTVQFTNNSYSPAEEEMTWLWDFGNGTTSTDRDPSVTYTEGGIYTVTLTATSTSNQAGTWQDSIEVLGDCGANVVEMPDANLAAAIRNALDLPEDQGLCESYLKTLNYLYADDANIQDLTGLEKAVNLRELNLSNNSICDISPISSLTHLQWLNLSGNLVSDVSPLSNLVSLEQAVLSHNFIVDLSPLVSGTTLSSGDQLYLWNNPLSTQACTDIATLQTAGVAVYADDPCGTLAGQPIARFTADPTGGIPPLDVQFTDHSWAPESDPIIAWHWDFGDGTTSSEQNPRHTFSEEDTFTVSLYVMTESHVSSNWWSMQIDAVVPSHPQVSIGWSISEGDAPLSVNFWDYSWVPDGTPIVTWQWDFGDGSTSTQRYPTHVYTSGGSFSVMLTVTSDAGVSNTRTWSNIIQVWGTCTEVIDIPDAGLAAAIRAELGLPDTQPLCKSYMQGLTGLGAAEYLIKDLTGIETAVNLTWINLNSNLISDISPLSGLTALQMIYLSDNIITDLSPLVSRKAFSPGSELYLWNNPLGTQACEDIATLQAAGVIVYFDEPCGGSANRSRARFSAEPKEGLPPLDVQFTDLSWAPEGDPITAWHWNFGDGTTSTEQNPRHTYSQEGYFWAALYVTTASNVTSSWWYTRIIAIVPSHPQVSFDRSASSGDAPLSVSFWDNSWVPDGTPIASWLWDFGDGGTSTEQNPTYTYTTGGLFSVSLTVTTEAGVSNTLTRPDLIWVNGECTDVANIPDPGLAAAIRAQLSIPESQPLCRSYLVRLTYLYAYGRQIESLEGLDEAVNLTDVDLGNNRISDVTPIAGLTALTYVYLGSNIITDISALASGTAFATGDALYLWNNPLGAQACTDIATLQAAGVEVNFDAPCGSTATQPRARFSADPMEGRPPLTVQFADQSWAPEGDPIVSWQWDFGDGSSSTEQNPTHTFVQERSYNVSLQVTTASSVSSTWWDMRIDALVPEHPQIDFGWSASSSDAPVTVNFWDYSWVPDGTPIVSWLWNFGDGSTSTEQSPTHVYNEGGSYSVSLTATSQAGFSNTRTKSNVIWVQGACTDIVDIPDPGLAAAIRRQLGISETQALCRSYLQRLTYLYSYRSQIADLTGLEAAENLSDLELNDNRISDLSPLANLASLTYVDLRNNFITDLSALVSGSILTSQAEVYLYNNPLGSQACTDITTLQAAGMTVYVEDPCGGTATVPRPKFAADPKEGRPPLAVQFTDQSWTPEGDPIVSWQWDFQDGSTSAAQNPSHTFVQEGSYYVLLTVTTSSGASSAWGDSIYVVIPELPQVSFGYSPRSGEAPLNVSFSDWSWVPDGTPITSWQWDFGDGGTSTEQSPTHTYTVGGLYSVSLTVTTEAGFSDSELRSNIVTVIGPCEDTVDIPDAGLAAAIRQQLSLPDSQPLCRSYVQALTGLNASSGHITELTGLEAAVNLIELDLSNNSIADVSALANLSALQTLTLSGNLITDITPLVSGTALSSGDQLSLWNNPLSTQVCTDIATLAAAGVTVYAEDPCDSSANQPRARFTADPSEGRPPLAVQFTDHSWAPVGDSIVSWYWTFNDGTTSTEQNPQHTFSQDDYYWVSLTVTTGTGISSSWWGMYINVITPERPRPDFGYSPNSGDAPLAVSFWDYSWVPDETPIVSWQWDFGDGGSSTEQNPTHTYTMAGIFSVSLTVTTQASITNSTTRLDCVKVLGPCDEAVDVPDAALATVIRAQLGIPETQALCRSFLERLTYLDAYDRGIVDLTGLEAAVNLTSLNLNNNLITDVSPLAGLASLEYLVLSSNFITDLSPLSSGSALTSGDTFYIWSNPLGTQACADIATLQAAGVSVSFDEPCGSWAQQPWARFTAEPKEGLPPLEVHFTDHSWAPEGDPIVGWMWDFGDGDTSTEQNPSHTFLQEGYHGVYLSVFTASNVYSYSWGTGIYVLSEKKSRP